MDIGLSMFDDGFARNTAPPPANSQTRWGGQALPSVEKLEPGIQSPVSRTQCRVSSFEYQEPSKKEIL